MIFQFGVFQLDTERRLLLRDGKPVALRPKLYDLLIALIQRRGQLAEKEYLIGQVWPDTAVTDNSLTVAIWDLRNTLGNRDQLVTIPGRGYRFLAPICQLPRTGTASALHEAEHPASSGPCSLFRLAVLPFVTLSPQRDPCLEMGLADAIITRLSRLSQVKVRPSCAVAKYHLRRLPDDVGDIGRKLLVDMLLTGYVQRKDDKLRVTVQLVRVDNGVALWAGKFDAKAKDFFSLEDSISEGVAQALTHTVGLGERHQLSKWYTENSEAYRAYLKARHFFDKRTDKDLQTSFQYLSAAVRLDPGFALAYVGLADYYILQGIYCAQPADTLWSRAKAAAVKALSIDDSLAAAHTSLGYACAHAWEWKAAACELQAALELDPHSASAHHWYADYLAAVGRVDMAVAEMHRALELDPLSLMTNTNLGLMLFYAHRYREATAQLKETLAIDPGFVQAHLVLGEVHAQAGRFGDALEEVRAAQDAGEHLYARAAEGYVLALAGQLGDVHRIVDELNNYAHGSYLPPETLALVYTGLGDRAQAFRWLERAFAARSPWLVYLKVIPAFQSLKPDPRYSDLLRRLGLEDTTVVGPGSRAAS